MPRGVYDRKKTTEGTEVTEPDLCEKCFPAGWPEDSYRAGCEHGAYERTESSEDGGTDSDGD